MHQLQGVVLVCGPFDLGLARQASTTAGGRFIQIVLCRQAPLPRRPRLRNGSVTDNLTSAFLPALVTVGNADPLREHSELLVEKLRAYGIEPETVFFPADHEPPLGHEYQFDLDTEEGQLFLERTLVFLRQRLGPADQA